MPKMTDVEKDFPIHRTCMKIITEDRYAKLFNRADEILVKDLGGYVQEYAMVGNTVVAALLSSAFGILHYETK